MKPQFFYTIEHLLNLEEGIGFLSNLVPQSGRVLVDPKHPEWAELNLLAVELAEINVRRQEIIARFKSAE